MVAATSCPFGGRFKSLQKGIRVIPFLAIGSLYSQFWGYGEMVIMPACHAGGPGSIPGNPEHLLSDWIFGES